jgi:CRISPR/Cas system-associated exonuclease Cas4 (RecB family)
MVSTKEIEERFLANVKKANEIKHPPRPHRVRDKDDDVSITDICVWHCLCPRSVYYNKVVGWPATPRSLLRFDVGNAVHEYAINEDGNEIAFEYKGFRCRMDDLNMEEGWIADKKSVNFLPRGAKKYPTIQLNAYKVIAEENETQPFKVNQLFVMYICVVDGSTACYEVDIWEPETTKNLMFSTREEILNHVRTRTLPPDPKGWWCEGCQYTELCQNQLVEAPVIEMDEKKTHVENREKVNMIDL